MKKKLIRSPCIGQSTILAKGNLPPKTKKIIDLLYSEDFKKGELSYYHIWRHIFTQKERETVKYWYYKIYLPEKFKTRYLKQVTNKFLTKEEMKLITEFGKQLSTTKSTN